ncbi:hypothetical protein DdX_22270 [Ditylenchus destructor]|uniref:HTH cro/C1-type domain-containing protein n=1 Tax=Ditylenchus destructor TaxID=166010 RepID=A0AAD4MEG9_9BILA|nr:hypothetical protein DdX_22270 [Ditylenchus destructor]
MHLGHQNRFQIRKSMLDGRQMTPSLGTIVKRLRQERGWKLSDMSRAVGIPLSTFLKIENDKLTLSYDKLQQFAPPAQHPVDRVVRRTGAQEKGRPSSPRPGSIATLDRAIHITTNNYEYSYFPASCVTPDDPDPRACNVQDAGRVRRAGAAQRRGIRLCDRGRSHSPYRVLRAGDAARGRGRHIDSTMGHAYLVAPGYEEAAMLGVCASGDEHLQDELIAEAEARQGEDGADTGAPRWSGPG